MNDLFKFVRKENRLRRLIPFAMAGTVVQWIIFKGLYPYPDFFSDSYSYLFAASEHLNISIWPIGYSKFLEWFHAISHSGTALVSFQYFFLELSALYFFLSIHYFYNLSRSSLLILYFALFFNPLFLFLSNYVNSDPLFAALSLLWMTELIWILNRPRFYQVFTQAVLLFLAFTVRNNAYYYPVISALAFLLSNGRGKGRMAFKIAGILLGPLLILQFVLYTRAESQKLTGTNQFSLFTGWQLANNALYMFEHIQTENAQWPTPACQELDSLSKSYFSHITDESNYRDYLADYPGNFFIKESLAPLKRYASIHYKFTDRLNATISWGKVSAEFEPFGSYLIKTHPVAFARYFLLLNARHYFLPPLEKLSVYNLESDKIDPLAAKWFDYPRNTVTAASYDAQGYVLYIFPILFLIGHLYLAWCIVSMVLLKKLDSLDPLLKRAFFLMLSFLFLNFCFCVFATIIVFRYEFVPMVILFSTLFLQIDALADKKHTIGQLHLINDM
jgi:hypothetical protein